MALYKSPICHLETALSHLPPSVIAMTQVDSTLGAYLIALIVNVA